MSLQQSGFALTLDNCARQCKKRCFVSQPTGHLRQELRHLNFSAAKKVRFPKLCMIIAYAELLSIHNQFLWLWLVFRIIAVLDRSEWILSFSGWILLTIQALFGYRQDCAQNTSLDFDVCVCVCLEENNIYSGLCRSCGAVRDCWSEISSSSSSIP